MKAFNARRSISTLLALVSFLLSMPQGVLVACVGVSGQVRIEVSSWEPLTSEVLRVREGPASSADQCVCGDGCGPCRETEIGLEDMTFHLPATGGAIGPALAHAVSSMLPAHAMCQPLEMTLHSTTRGGSPHSPPGLRSMILRV